MNGISDMLVFTVAVFAVLGLAAFAWSVYSIGYHLWVGMTKKAPKPVVLRAGEVLKGRRKSPWGGENILVEMDEPFPYIDQPNPRRAIWMHESQRYEPYGDQYIGRDI